MRLTLAIGLVLATCFSAVTAEAQAQDKQKRT